MQIDNQSCDMHYFWPIKKLSIEQILIELAGRPANRALQQSSLERTGVVKHVLKENA